MNKKTVTYIAYKDGDYWDENPDKDLLIKWIKEHFDKSHVFEVKEIHTLQTEHSSMEVHGEKEEKESSKTKDNKIDKRFYPRLFKIQK